jgi:hypothetical protein
MSMSRIYNRANDINGILLDFIEIVTARIKNDFQ